MTTDMAIRDESAILERVIALGDLSKLDPNERIAYYRAVCESVGLNPLTKPLDYITLNGKLTLYANKGATDQIRRNRGVSIDRVEREVVEGIYVVTVYGHDGSGRVDSDMGTVPIRGLSGDNLANAMLKALTKAKRRLTLSLCGLGMLDELEVATIPSAQRVDVDQETGEILRIPQTTERVIEPPAVSDDDLSGLNDPALWADPELVPAYPSETAEGMSSAEFKAFLTAEGFTSGDAMNAAYRIFPSWNGKRDLTNAERQSVRRALVTA